MKEYNCELCWSKIKGVLQSSVAQKNFKASKTKVLYY